MPDPHLSHVIGETTPPLLEHTIGAALDLAAQTWPDAEALVSRHQSVRLTWRRLRQEARETAAGLLALGLRPGDRVAVWAPNCAEWAIAQFATALAGLIQVNINPAYRTSELAYTLKKVGVKALIAADRFKTSDYPAMVEELAPQIAASAVGQLTAPDLPMLRLLIKIGGPPRPGWLAFADTAAHATPAHTARLETIAAGLTADDPINIQFTSGTTGQPKGATLTHRNILNNGRFVGLAMGLRAGDRLCIPVPLYHCFGMVMGNLACVVHGATMIYPSEGFEPRAVLETVAAERCTALFGVPTMFIAELEHPDFASFDLASLRTGIMAGAPCPAEIMRKVIGRMHMRDVAIAYGMTETSPVSFQTATTDDLARRVETIGRVQPHLEVKLVDDTGAVVARDRPGELCTRGYAVMRGYWDDEAKTAEAIDAEGWMHTGDLAVIDAAGYARIVGRIKDMIIRGGENVYPRELEDYLLTHPSIEDVHVIGVPDEKYGEEICAWIKPRGGADLAAEDVIAFCRGRIAHYKVPRLIRFVDAFPMTVTGKVQKFEMRKTMTSERPVVALPR